MNDRELKIAINAAKKLPKTRRGQRAVVEPCIRATVGGRGKSTPYVFSVVVQDFVAKRCHTKSFERIEQARKWRDAKRAEIKLRNGTRRRSVK